MTHDRRHGVSASLMDYLRLFRAPNLFTAVADVTTGFLCARASLAPLPPLLCLIASSGLLYTAGMVLNDVFDVRVDLRTRPDRPLPARRISLRWARSLGFTLLLTGAALGWLAGFLLVSEQGFNWRSGAVATLLALSVLAYDGLLKRTPAGPIAMGSCRFLNVLLGASVGAMTATDWNLVGFQSHQLVAAGGIGIYVAGITWFAKREAEQSGRLGLSCAVGVMAVGFCVLGLLHRTLPPSAKINAHLPSELAWILLLALLAFTILRRCVVAILDPSPRQVQTAVKVGILSIIVLDAAVALEVSHWHYAVGLLALLAPTVVLSKWVYST